MGKPFNNELEILKSTVEWAESQDITLLSKFLFEENRQIPLICIGSGGSLSACHYAAMLYQKQNGVLSTAMTPLQLMYSGKNIIRDNKLLFLSASGKNKDILNAIKYGVKYNDAGMMSLTFSKNNPTEKLLEQYSKVFRWCEDIPSGKDGFLATNSLIATFSLLSICFDGEAISHTCFVEDSYYKKSDFDFSSVQNFIVLYGVLGESVAWDIESKLTEAALGSTLMSDYRNFGHGRHHWFAKKKENSCIIALITPNERELAEKTIDCLPKDIPLIYIETEQETPKASIDLLIKAFHFVKDLGMSRGIDPGRPGVPSYGRALYNLDYFKLTNRILPAEKTLDAAVRRKLGGNAIENVKLWKHYCEACQYFVRQLNRGTFTTIAFDYDGTLSAPDYDSRFNQSLQDSIKNALLLLLKNGLRIVIATGRGKSVGDVFMKSIDRIYWPQIKIGYYNGACLLTLGEESVLEEWKNDPFDGELRTLCTELRNRFPEGCIDFDTTERNLQLSIENVKTASDAEILYNACCEIIWDKQLKCVHIWRSSHSMDIVVYHRVSKKNVIEELTNTLCIGDYGNMEGNDYELLSGPASLSVDKVSKKADCCWNIAPSGVKGLDATLFYLSKLTVKDGFVKCKFSV